MKNNIVKSSILPMGGPEAIVANIAVGVAKDIIAAGADYLKCREHEQTERRRIAALLEAKLTEINKKSDLYSYSVKTTHEETMAVYQTFQNLLKSPYIAENPSLVEKIMDNMMLHHSSAGDRFKDKIDGIRELF